MYVYLRTYTHIASYLRIKCIHIHIHAYAYLLLIKLQFQPDLVSYVYICIVVFVSCLCLSQSMQIKGPILSKRKSKETCDDEAADEVMHLF